MRPTIYPAAIPQRKCGQFVQFDGVDCAVGLAR